MSPMSPLHEEGDVERIAMRTKEIRRAAVFAQVRTGRTTLGVAAQHLGVSYR